MAANLRTWLQEWGGQPDGVARPVQEGPFSGPALLWNAATPRINLANGVTPTGDGTGVSEIVGPYGKEADFSGSGTGRYIFATAPEQDAVTIAIEARVDTTTDIDRLVSAYNGAGSGKYDIYVDAVARWYFQVFRATTNGRFWFSAGLSPTFKGTLVISHTLDATPQAYFNGNELSVSVLSAGSGATVASSNLLGIGGRTDVTTQQLDGGISTVWRLDRALPASAAQMLSQPGALSRLLYEPRRIYIPTQSAAAAAPTITALSARLITASSAQPRISYS